MQKYAIPGHEPSLLPEGYRYSLCFSDEFDTPTLDRSKWSFRKHIFHGEHACWLEDEGIELKDGNIIFKLVEKDGKYYSSQLQTGENWYDRPSGEGWGIAKFSQPKFLHRFGYYETRCKLQKGSNWWSAFWLQSPNIGTQPDEKRAGVEVDIMESFFGGSYIPHFIHWGGYGANYQFATTRAQHGFVEKEDSIEIGDGFHRFGVLWEEDGYTFFVDGVQSGRKLTEAVSHTEEFILIGTEVVGYRKYVPGIYKGYEMQTVPDDAFVVDYVRVFDFEKE